MLKFNIIPIVALLLVLSNSSFAQCKSGKHLAKVNKADMKPFNLDSYVDNEFSYGKKDRNIETPFTAYSGESYRLIFCSDNIPQAVTISVYDKNGRAKSRKELYSYTYNPGDAKAPPFEMSKPGNYFIEYNIPASDDQKVVKKGCLYTLIGFKEVDETPQKKSGK